MRLGNLDLSGFIEVYELLLRNITVLSHNIIPIEVYKKS